VTRKILTLSDKPILSVMKHEITEEQIQKDRELKELREKVSHYEKVSQSVFAEL
jgi:hypothetical protein